MQATRGANADQGDIEKDCACAQLCTTRLRILCSLYFWALALRNQSVFTILMMVSYFIRSAYLANTR